MITLYTPKNDKLRKHIHSFAIFDVTEVPLSYWAFPQFGTSAVLLRGIEAKAEGAHLTFCETNQEHVQSFMLGRYLHPLLLTYHGTIREVSINFQPLGVNHFLQEPFGVRGVNETMLSLNQTEWLELTRLVYAETDADVQIELLEDFFLQKLNSQPLDGLEKAVDLIISDSEITIQELADVCAYSERNLSRSFNKYVGCSPLAFKRIAKFRTAVGKKFQSNSDFNLTQLCMESGYYDSSHFAREFKKLTDQSPRAFFRNISNVDGNSIPYQFL